MSKNIYLSLIVPFYNEAKNLPLLHNEIVSVFGKIGKKSEVVYVDDGSTDNSAEVLSRFVGNKNYQNISVKIIKLRRNFGQTAATSAGIDNSTGSLIGFLDADLQNDPKDLIYFLDEIERGYDAVFGWRRKREDPVVRLLFSRIANLIIRVFFRVPLHDVGCSLKVVKRAVLKDLHLYGESHRIMPVLIYWRGAKIKELAVNHRGRVFGQSKYGWGRILKLIIDLITAKFLTSYGTKPAYVFGSLGLGSIFVGFLTLVMVAYRKLFLGVFVHRDPLFLITVFLVLLGVQFILMGFLAELLVRVYFESQKKSIYEVKEIKTF